MRNGACFSEGSGVEVNFGGVFFNPLSGEPLIRANLSLTFSDLSVQRSGLPHGWQAWVLCCTSPATGPAEAVLQNKQKKKHNP